MTTTLTSPALLARRGWCIARHRPEDAHHCAARLEELAEVEDMLRRQADLLVAGWGG